jgi:hypothetical protein
MTLDPRIDRLRSAASRRHIAIVVGCMLLPALALALLIARSVGANAALAFGALALIAFGVAAWIAARRVDERWLARRMDALAPAMDDSSALLFDAAALTPLQALQRVRLQQRLDALALDLRPQWPRRAFTASAIGALLLFALALLWSPRDHAVTQASPATAAAHTPTVTRIAQADLEISPPAYTQAAVRTESALDVKVPEGSRLRWTLRFEPQPAAASLQFHDGHRVALTRSGESWSGEQVLAASALYRIVLDAAPPPADDRLHRLDAIVDRAPEIHAIKPDKTLSLVDAQQKTWELAFEARDDYAIANAQLLLTHAQGTGENIAFKEQTIALDGEASDDPRARVFNYTVDLAALGIAKGDDVIVRLLVADNREPKPNTTRSPSFILRWPPDPAKDSAGLEGIVQKTMPAYFRSQRQIIIDTEGLIAERAQLDDAKFLARSDSIGVDQKLLRLRYGQFLGEESEGHAEHAPENAVGGADTQVGALAAAHEAQERAEPATPAKFGEEGNVLAEYGHVHDIAEAATLLDPETRATLKSALDEMWQAELHLRQGHPDEALPYEHRALDFIKQVQQATRIYLARVGLELPAPDEARRLSGERKDLVDRVGTLTAAPPTPAAALVELWHALDAGATPDWDAAEHAIAAQGSSVDTLGVLAALDRARRAPACADCRAQLRSALWPLLPTPAAASVPRAVPDAAGRAYLDAIQPERSR